MATAKSKKNQAQSQLAEVFNMIQAPVVPAAGEEVESEDLIGVGAPVDSVASGGVVAAVAEPTVEVGVIPPLPLRRKRRETRSRKTCLGFRESVYQAMKRFTAENDISLNDLIEAAVAEFMERHKEGV